MYDIVYVLICLEKSKIMGENALAFCHIIPHHIAFLYCVSQKVPNLHCNKNKQQQWVHIVNDRQPLKIVLC